MTELAQGDERHARDDGKGEDIPLESIIQARLSAASTTQDRLG